jgi:hypothetical protein
MYSNIEYRSANIIRDLNPLSIERIRIPAKNGATKARAPPTEPELPDSVRRMGRFLLNMLRIEYERRQVPIANLSIADANMRLKDQIRKFLKAVYPFDRDLRPGESAYEWWVSLDQDRSNDAQPLAVCDLLIRVHRLLTWFVLSDLVSQFSRLFRIQWLTSKLALPSHGLILICETASKLRHSFGQCKFRSGTNMTLP